MLMPHFCSTHPLLHSCCVDRSAFQELIIAATPTSLDCDALWVIRGSGRSRRQLYQHGSGLTRYLLSFQHSGLHSLCLVSPETCNAHSIVSE
jgi:hypothetical protein